MATTKRKRKKPLDWRVTPRKQDTIFERKCPDCKAWFRASDPHLASECPALISAKPIPGAGVIVFDEVTIE